MAQKVSLIEQEVSYCSLTYIINSSKLVSLAISLKTSKCTEGLTFPVLKLGLLWGVIPAAESSWKRTDGVSPRVHGITEHQGFVQSTQRESNKKIYICEEPYCGR